MEVLKPLAGLACTAGLAILLLAAPAAAKSECVAADDAPRPILEAESLAGGTVSLAGERGRPVVLDIWATWCGSCRTTLRRADALAATTAPERLAVIGISIDRNSADAAAWLVQNLPDRHLRIWQAAPGTTFAALDIRALPATLLLDAGGRVLRHHEGSEGAGLDALLRQARDCAARLKSSVATSALP
jgi:thiol-disulfide isomerase/thioredoxin